MLTVLLFIGCDNKDNPVRTSLDVETSTLTLYVGESSTRTATTKAAAYQITYTSSNPAVATVDQTGKVTAKSEGEAVITVEMDETIKSWYAAKTLAYNVVVRKASSDDDGGVTPAPAPVVPVTGVVISGDATLAPNGYTGQLTATVTPATATDPSVTWTSSHPGILAVDANGNVSLVALPASTTNVTITATSNSNPAVSDSKVISVVGCSGIVLSSATVGMIICSHGKAHAVTSGALACGGKKVAVVAYKGSAGTADTTIGSSGYVGLAIALKDANNGYTCRWCDEDLLNDGCSYAFTSSDLATVLGTSISFGAGLDNTYRLVNLPEPLGSDHCHPAADAAADYKYDASVAAGAHPANTSQWFLPTMYQWNLMVKSMCGDHGNLSNSVNNYYKTDSFSAKITAAGGDPLQSAAYWSSTGYINPSVAWFVGFYFGNALGNNVTTDYYVRPVIAF